MTIIGTLSDFSLPELFQFLEQGQKTGQLTLTPSDSQKTVQHHVWFRQGRIVAAADRGDHKGLLSLMRQRGWVQEKVVELLTDDHLKETPLGIYMKSQGLLEAEKLKLLFYVQVMQQVCKLFTLSDAQFSFDPHISLPMIEMTGLSSPGTEVTLAGLRALKDWSSLDDKLPTPTSALTSVVAGKPQLRLNQTEWQVWEYTDGDSSLDDIAEQLQLPIEQVQQIAFRLIVVNLVEELPMVHLIKAQSAKAATHSPNEENALSGAGQGLSQDFLNSLMGFLQKKAA
ncbi:MAG: DUF4388 domain-containing protein [Microcystaceae cyanobacterium]